MTNGSPADIVVIAAGDVPAQPWRNGGGQTRELLAWPAGNAWRVRVSRADIERDGPFSAFPQVQRWFAVLEGQGVVLHFPEGEHPLRPFDDALQFDGAEGPGCRLIAGPTQDLNLMLRGASGSMRAWRSGQTWDSPYLQRGLYTTVAGQWQSGQQVRLLPAHSLLWAGNGGGGTWSFRPHQPDAGGTAWWLGCTPQD